MANNGQSQLEESMYRVKRAENLALLRIQLKVLRKTECRGLGNPAANLQSIGTRVSACYSLRWTCGDC